MAIRDLTSERLFVNADLAAGLTVDLSEPQAHYLTKVLRLPAGAHVLVFNGRHGEWSAALEAVGKRAVVLHVLERTRAQETGPDIDYVFAPLKRSRLDYMVQKVTELGVRRLIPVMTERTIAERINDHRMRANVIEAAEQCGILTIPDVLAPLPLEGVLKSWDQSRHLILCDEAAALKDPIAALKLIPAGPVAVLLGPEGGFSGSERERLLSCAFVTPLSLGPRIMRADTAAVAVLALVNAVMGDWRG